MRILITGGTGSLGKALLKKLDGEHTVCVFSRDEGKHALLPQHICKMIGDVRDRDRLDYVMRKFNPDIIYHAAAKKRIDDMELYPDECVKTNILGTQNVAWAADKNNVHKCVLISTDKACQPINVYGSTKFIAERIFSNYNLFSETIFTSVRYGNVLCSRGSFVPLWKDKLLNGDIINVTSKECTRFLFTLDDAVNFIVHSVELASGGEVFIPVMSSYYIIDVVRALEGILNKEAIVNFSGMRPGEKIHEDMVGESEMDRCHQLENGNLVILPEYYNVDLKYNTNKYTGVRLNSAYYVNTNLDSLVSLLKRSLDVQ